jgi:hypothetical protein
MTLGSESWEGVVVWLGGLGGNWSCFSSCLKKHGSHNPEYIGLYWVVLPPGNHQPTGFCERSHLRRRYRSAARLCRYQVDFFGNQACPCSCTFHSSWSLKPERFHSHHDSLLVEGTAKSDLGLMFFVGAKKNFFLLQDVLVYRVVRKLNSWLQSPLLAPHPPTELAALAFMEKVCMTSGWAGRPGLHCRSMATVWM